MEQRIARVFLRLAEEHGHAHADGTLVPLRVSRQKLAAIIGCRVETLVRALRHSELTELMSDRPEGVLLHDVAALRSLAYV